MTREEKMYCAIQGAFKDTAANGLPSGTLSASWQDISAAVTAANIKVKNWLVVRGVLQWMINRKQVQRTSNIHVEVYVLNFTKSVEEN